MASIARESRRSASMVSWTLLGLTLGAAAGFAAAVWFGPLAPDAVPRRPGRSRRFRSSAPHMAPLVREVADLIAADAELAAFDLEAVAVSARRVELHGWVPTRELRARAWRLARQAPGIESLINCILVHGEDDSAPAPTTA